MHTFTISAKIVAFRGESGSDDSLKSNVYTAPTQTKRA